jgi:hypothetical protein
MMLFVAIALAAPAWEAQVEPVEDEGTGFTFLGVVQARGSAGNVVNTNPFFNGQVVGVLDGANGTTVSDTDKAVTAEQRAVGFLSYRPVALNGQAGLTAGFEVDFAWGDAAYGTGGNAGGGFGGDQVNLQTRRLHADFDGGPTHTIVGLQFVGDSVTDPTRAPSLDALYRSGGRLMVWGSEAAGVQSFGTLDTLSWRAGAFTLVEGDFSQNDDVGLLMADVELRPAPGLSVGLHGWHLRDRAGGQVGPTSALSGLQGAAIIDHLGTVVDADLSWVGVDVGYDPSLSMGRVGAHGVVLANLGRLYIEDEVDQDISSVLVDLEARARWAAGAGSLFRAELLYTGSEFVTGNSYGVVGAAWGTHGTLLLHPDRLAINRQVSQYSDVSAGGVGMVSLSGSLGYDLVPNKLNVTLGGGHAVVGERSAQEGNLRLTATPLPLLQVGVAGAYMARPDTDAWLVLTTLDWIVF